MLAVHESRYKGSVLVKRFDTSIPTHTISEKLGMLPSQPKLTTMNFYNFPSIEDPLSHSPNQVEPPSLNLGCYENMIPHIENELHETFSAEKQEIHKQNRNMDQGISDCMQDVIYESPTTHDHDELQDIQYLQAVNYLQELQVLRDIEQNPVQTSEAVHQLHFQIQSPPCVFPDLPLQDATHAQTRSHKVSQPSLQTPTYTQVHAPNPAQLQILAQNAAHAQLLPQSTIVQMPSEQWKEQAHLHTQSPHHERELSQNDLSRQIEQLQTQFDVLLSQIKAKELQDALQHSGQRRQETQPSTEAQIEVPPVSQFDGLDEIQPNVPLEKSSGKKERRRRKAQFQNEKPQKRRRVTKGEINNDSDIYKEADGQVKCSHCDDIFANLDAMNRHFRMVHSNKKEKTHVCEECQQRCRSALNLWRHWNSAHNGELNFICEECGARFTTRRSCSLHRTNQHPDVYKPGRKRKKTKFHKCQVCNYTSDQTYSVMRHFFTMHTDVVIKCLYGCGNTFKSAANAKVHYLTCKHRPSIIASGGASMKTHEKSSNP